MMDSYTLHDRTMGVVTVIAGLGVGYVFITGLAFMYTLSMTVFVYCLYSYYDANKPYQQTKDEQIETLKESLEQKGEIIKDLRAMLEWKFE